MPFEIWLIYLAAAVGLSLAPGPNGLLSLTHGARFGLRPTIFTALGGGLGFLLLIAISLAGFGALLAASERAFSAMKWAGAAYLVYLGIRLALAPPTDFRSASRAEDSPSYARNQLFQQGFWVAVSNPKGMLFFAAFLPQFMIPGAGFWQQLAILGGTFVLIEFLYELLLASMAQRIAPWLMRCGHWFNRITGGAFVAMGAALAATSR